MAIPASSRPCSPAYFLKATGRTARHGIALHITGSGQPLLAAALKSTTRFTKPQIQRLLHLLTGKTPPHNMRLGPLQQALIEATFENDAAQAAEVQAAYAVPAVTAEAALDARVDDNLALVIDIMQEEDADNCGEFRDVRDAVRRRRARNAAQAAAAAAPGRRKGAGRGRRQVAAPKVPAKPAPPTDTDGEDDVEAASQEEPAIAGDTMVAEDGNDHASAEEVSQVSPAEPGEFAHAAAETNGAGHDSADELGAAAHADPAAAADTMADGTPVIRADTQTAAVDQAQPVSEPTAMHGNPGSGESPATPPTGQHANQQVEPAVAEVIPQVQLEVLGQPTIPMDHGDADAPAAPGFPAEHVSQSRGRTCC